MLSTSVNHLDDDILKLVGMEVPSDAEREAQRKNVLSAWDEKLEELKQRKSKSGKNRKGVHELSFLLSLSLCLSISLRILIS
jgi:hypothetical protein